MPSNTASGSAAKAIGNALLQMTLLPVNFIIWLVTSPELMTLLCILSEILIELVVSAVMAGVSIIVSAVILMEDEPEPTLIMTPPSSKKKSFLHGGDPTCTDLDKEEKEKRKDEDGKDEDGKSEDGKSDDKTTRRRSSGTNTKGLSLLDSWLPKYGAPRGDPNPAEPLVPVEVSEPRSSVTQDSGELDVKLAELENDPQIQKLVEEIDTQLDALAGEETSQKADSEKADSEKADSEKAGSEKADSEKADSEKAVSETTDTGSEKAGSEKVDSEKA